jgi:hypothetical protein
MKTRTPRTYVNKAKVLRKKANQPAVKIDAWVFRPFRLKLSR